MHANQATNFEDVDDAAAKNRRESLRQAGRILEVEILWFAKSTLFPAYVLGTPRGEVEFRSTGELLTQHRFRAAFIEGTHVAPPRLTTDRFRTAIQHLLDAQVPFGISPTAGGNLALRGAR